MKDPLNNVKETLRFTGIDGKVHIVYSHHQEKHECSGNKKGRKERSILCGPDRN